MYYVIYDDVPFFFNGSFCTNYKHVIDTKTYVGDIEPDGYELNIKGESFNKYGYYIKTREYQVSNSKPIEITKEQFDIFKEEILKIEKLKDMFNTTATALYKLKSNASRTE